MSTIPSNIWRRRLIFRLQTRSGSEPSWCGAKKKSWYRRQHLETCVFSSLADELKSGDICVIGSEQFADYRDQLLPWEMCEPKVAAYCQQLGLPATAEGLVG